MYTWFIPVQATIGGQPAQALTLYIHINCLMIISMMTLVVPGSWHLPIASVHLPEHYCPGRARLFSMNFLFTKHIHHWNIGTCQGDSHFPVVFSERVVVLHSISVWGYLHSENNSFNLFMLPHWSYLFYPWPPQVYFWSVASQIATQLKGLDTQMSHWFTVHLY